MNDRLHRTEALLNSSEELSLGMADWLGGMLNRRPLSRPDAVWAPIAGFVDALWWDIHDRCSTRGEARVTERLDRTEVLLDSSEELRIGVCDWMGGTLRRPPLSRPDATWAPIAALLDSLWWDIHDRTPDPLSPEIEGLGIVPQTHPRLIENHPWNREDR